MFGNRSREYNELKDINIEWSKGVGSLKQNHELDLAEWRKKVEEKRAFFPAFSSLNSFKSICLALLRSNEIKTLTAINSKRSDGAARLKRKQELELIKWGEKLQEKLLPFVQRILKM